MMPLNGWRGGRVLAGLRRLRDRLKAFLGLGVGVLSCGGSAGAEAWKPALPGYGYELPRDHGQHPEHKIEWWYYTGNLEAVKGERTFGYQLTFFRIGVVAVPKVASAWALRDVWMAHLAITDVEGRRYHHADRLNRAGPGLAGAAGEGLEVWNEDWRAVGGEGGTMRLSAGEGEMGLELVLGASPLPMVIHGEDGISQKGSTVGNASHYYSLVQLPTEGTLRVGGEVIEVRGRSWMDHEFGSSFLEPGQQGWDWFSAQFEDGSALMLFQLRHEVGAERTKFAGTWIGVDGGVTPLSDGDFTLRPGGTWTSPDTGAVYPMEWGIRIPKLGVELTAEALVEAQEMRAELTPGLHYWEGAMRFRGERAGMPLEGRGYLEMTGYAGQSMSVWFGGGD